MNELLSLFASAPTNDYFESFLESEAEIIKQPIECTYYVKRMKAALGDWINSVLPEGVEQYMFYMIVINDIEHEMTQDECVEFLVKVIDGKDKHKDADSYYADTVRLIGEIRDDND